MSQRQINNREALLDSAEALFASNGYYLVTVREITRKAGVRMAEINDLFGSKEQLFYEVIKRRAVSVNLMRCQGLADIDARLPAQQQVEKVLAAFFDPLLFVSSKGEGWRNYLRLVPQVMKQRSPILVMITEFYTPVSDLFLKRLEKLYPQIPPVQLRRHWHFSLMVFFSVFGDEFRIGDLDYTPGLMPTPGQQDLQTSFSEAMAFVLAGFRNLLNSGN